MRIVMSAVASVFLLTASQLQAQTAPQGDPQKGRGMYMGASGGALCGLCHGMQAQGGFGPDIAGARGLTFDQFKRELQNPWGIMPRYSHITDQGAADLYAFLKSVPVPEKPGTWNVELPPAGAPKGQVYAVAYGCGQCHGPEMGHPRRDLGAKNADFEEFQKIVYEHAPQTMGQFSRERIPEPVLKEMWTFLKDMGLRSLVFGSIAPGIASGANTTYTLTLDNKGVPGKGLPADDIVINLVVPTGLSVVSATGTGYQGVKPGEYVPNPNTLAPFRAMNPTPNTDKVKGDLAMWKVAKLPAGEKQTFTITLSGQGADRAKFAGTFVTWGKPEVHRLPTVTVKDLRLADKGDIIYAPSLEFSLPPAPRPATQQNQQ
jgi:mono/diheme cytochrome c family protein